MPWWCENDPKWLNWFNEALLRREYHFNTSDLDEMESDHYFFLLELLGAEAEYREKLQKDAERKAKAGQRR